MRWKFVTEETAGESVERAAVKQRIAKWWQSFAERINDLDALFANKTEWDLPGWMHDQLNAISPELMWEFGPGLLGGHRLVITPETSHHLRPMVDEILASAPKISGWEFYSHRLPEGFDQATLTVDARGGGMLSAMHFQLTGGDFHRVDVRCLVKPDYPRDLMKATGFVAIETLLGEELLDRWIGHIDHEVVSEFPPDAVQGGGLLNEARLIISQIVASLPSDTWIGRCEKIQWSLFTLKPTAADEYPGRRDQLTQVSPYPELHQCIFNSSAFDSVRFSRCGEIFAFVKIDGKEGLPDWGFKDREDIEKALQAGLEATGLGSMIGGGNGLRYCYVDLALLDVIRAVPVIREVLARGGVSTRSWLLFSDRDFSEEWIGIYPESPPPPLEIE